MDAVWVVLSVIVPLLAFFVALRPWIKDVIRSETSEFKVSVLDKQSTIERRLSTLEGRFQEWAPITQKVAERLMERPSNPDGRRQELLEKWKAGTLSYQESVELRDILAKEAEEAEENKKNLVSLGLVALFLYALSKK